MNFWVVLLLNGAVGLIAQILMIKILERNAKDDVGEKVGKQAVDETLEDGFNDGVSIFSAGLVGKVVSTVCFLAGIFAWELVLPISYAILSRYIGNRTGKTKKDS